MIRSTSHVNGCYVIYAPSFLSHNLIRNIQLDTLATPIPQSRTRPSAYLIRGMWAARVPPVARASRLFRIGGRPVLRLSHHPATEVLDYASIDQRVAGRVILGVGAGAG